jgi:signal transduction histidine kinase
MSSRQNRRMVSLLLLALLVPCGLLAFLSVRIIRQESELGERRRLEKEEWEADRIARRLVGRLEQVREQELRAWADRTHSAARRLYQHPATVLVARIDGGRLIAPWDDDASTREFLEATREPRFASRIRQGEQAELVERQPARASAAYREALRMSRRPEQRGQALVLLARALGKSSGPTRAAAVHEEILALPSGIVDDQGLPIRLYGASQLAKQPGHEETLAAALREILAEPRWLSPAALYLLRDLSASIAAVAPDLPKAAERRLLEVEQVLALRDEYSKLATLEEAARRTASGEPVWLPFGPEELWLVRTNPRLGDLPASVLAVRAGPIFVALEEAGVTGLSTAPAPQSRPLGPGLPGLYLVASPLDAPTAEGWNLPQQFYLAALALALTVALLGGYLLWRDVRRELRMAELRGHFVSSVSHELRTPLTAIRMFAETLRGGRLEQEKTREEYLDTIVSESERLTRLVDNVLDFSRIERGQKAYRFQLLSLAEVVRAAARAVQYPLTSQGFRLTMEVDEELPMARGDPDALEQAVLNLLTNAIKYSGDSRDIGLRLRRVDGSAEIQVVDRGIGIPAEERKRVFEKFYRVPTRENELLPGTGLGLTLVEHVARAHGGHVTVESCPGEGSTFAIRIPLEGGR